MNDAATKPATPSDALPYRLEPRQLEALLPRADVRVVDVGAHDNHLRYRPPGAVHLAYHDLILGQPPAAGLLPPVARLEATMRGIGLREDTHVVAYDDQGNGRASRLLWTLEVLGHRRMSLLDGGLAAWCNEGHPTETGASELSSSSQSSSPSQPSSQWRARFNPAVLADSDYVLASLGDDDRMLLDARTPEEYNGVKSASPRRGHIPGAVNLNWLDTIDRARNLRLLPAEQLNAMLTRLGVSREREIIVYCQTHHRSAHSFVMLRTLGFERLRGYAGSWSQWSSDDALPIE
ncbi:MAG: sulfurtransferase [bacterium]